MIADLRFEISEMTGDLGFGISERISWRCFFRKLAVNFSKRLFMSKRKLMVSVWPWVRWGVCLERKRRASSRVGW